MAKKGPAQAVPSTYSPPPEVRFDLKDGLPGNLPSVKKAIRLEVSGTLTRVSTKTHPTDTDTIVVSNPKVKLLKSRG